MALAILLVIVFLGSILGFIAFSRTSRLEKELRQVRLEFTRFNAGINAGVSQQGAQPDEDQPDIVPDTSTAEEKTDVGAESAIEPQQAIVGNSDVETDQTGWALKKDDAKSAQWANSGDTPKPSRSLEETIASFWAVWVGGLALALGAVFLVKFSIERGLLNPGIRITLGLLFSAALVILGDWSRRQGEAFSFAGYTKANIPAILTAAGTMGAFATIYAAYELYNMLPMQLAFLALGLVAVGTTFAALLHGPLLAALGILASLLVPMLLSTHDPSIPGLGTYILMVVAAGFTVGRLRVWKWLAVTSAGGLILYGFILHGLWDISDQSGRLAVIAYILISWTLVTYVFVISLYKKSAPQLEKNDTTATVVSSVILLLVLGSTLRYPADYVSAVLLLAAVAGTFTVAFFYSASRAGIYAVMAISTIGYLGWSIDFNTFPEWAGMNHVDSFLNRFRISEQRLVFIWVGIVLAGAATAIGLWGALKSTSRAALAIGGAFLPILLFSANYFRVEVFSPSWVFCFVALIMFAGFLFVSNYIHSQMGDEVEGRDGASAAYAVAAFVALALSISIVLEKAALTIALALLVPAIAFVYSRRPLPALRLLAACSTVLWIGRIVWAPGIIDGDLGTTPVFNWLTYGYGVPSAGFAIASWLLGRSGRDKWLEILEGVTLASIVATLGLVGLHAIDPAQVFTPIDTLEEAALITIIGAGVSLALLLMHRTKTSPVLKQAVTLLGFAGMLMAASGLLWFFNPWISKDSFGSGLIFNGLLFAYVFPGILFLSLAGYARGKRDLVYVGSAAVLGALLLAAWVNLTIRHMFHASGLHLGPTTDGELYTYSIVWLLIGIGILITGIGFRARQLRLVAVGILLLVVAKVFLIDMSGLEGLLRALSFIGLGATLIGIGLVYQRVLSNPDFYDRELEDEIG
jgi:uncharacterized membrane protein